MNDPERSKCEGALGEMPIIGTAFEKVAIDLVGPLVMSDRKHRWILTTIDFATMYPIAIPMTSIETVDVAEALVSIFAGVGIPWVILSDRGSQFTSDLMKELTRLLWIKQLTTTPYHVMCNGLVEKFNGTLKSILKRMTHERPGDWDRFIPALLFAYREVPQESLTFSPFELLYGRTVRGPMSILRELWPGEITSDETRTTYQYVMELRERTEETCRLEHEELKKAKVTQKEYDNRKARDKCLSDGEKVLLLLPTDNNKLLLQWKGPYDIIQKVAVNDYSIQIGENTNTFHANMLRKYVSRENSDDKRINDDVVQGLQLVREDQDSQLGSEYTMFCSLEATESWTDVSMCTQLTDVQQVETRRLLEEYIDVFSDLPGCTDIAECTIELVGRHPDAM